KAPSVLADGKIGQPVGGSDPAVQGAGAFGGLGGVLGYIGGDLGVGQVSGGGDRPDVVFATPVQGAGRRAGSGRGFQVDGAGGLDDGAGEHVEGGPGGRGGRRPGGAVEPDDGVEVDHAAALVFGDLGVGDAQLRGERRAAHPGLAGECPAQGNGEAAPEFGGRGVEQDRAGVVVAVRAVPAASAGPTSQDAAVFLAAGVDRAEGRRGQGGEDARVLGDGRGDSLAAAQSGADELVGIGAVDLGTGRAPGGAASLAGDGQDPAGFVHGGVAVQQLPGGTVDVIDTAAQQDRLQAPACVPGRARGDGDGGQRQYSSRHSPVRAVVDERRQATARRMRTGLSGQPLIPLRGAVPA